VDQDAEKVESLRAFKAKLRKKPVGFWTSADDLHGKFAIALMKLIVTSPRVGWVRTSEAPGAEVVTELSRLSRENATLRAKLQEAQGKTGEDAMAAREQTLRTLRRNKVELVIMYAGAGEKWTDPIEISLYALFEKIAAQMVIEKSVEDTANYVARMYHDEVKHVGKKPLWVAKNSLKHWLSDLMTLGLVAPSDRRHPVADKNEYWALTEEGQLTLTLLRRRRLERAEKPEIPPAPPNKTPEP
jgi:hypothetical protein